MAVPSKLYVAALKHHFRELFLSIEEKDKDLNK